MRMILGAAAGGLAGFAYQRWIGCRSGACVILSSRPIATLYGALIGLLWAMR